MNYMYVCVGERLRIKHINCRRNQPSRCSIESDGLIWLLTITSRIAHPLKTHQ